MFIDLVMYPKTCAPAERDVSGQWKPRQATFRSAGAKRNILDVVFYKHSAPTEPVCVLIAA